MMATASVRGVERRPLSKMPVNMIHSAVKLAKGGKPDSIIAPMTHRMAVTGIFLASPPICRMSRMPVV